MFYLIIKKLIAQQINLKTKQFINELHHAVYTAIKQNLKAKLSNNGRIICHQLSCSLKKTIALTSKKINKQKRKNKFHLIQVSTLKKQKLSDLICGD